MNVLATGRRCGKTTWALEWLKDAKPIDSFPGYDRVLLVHNHEMKKHIEGMAKSPNQVQVFYTWINKLAKGTDPNIEIVIDEAGLVLQELLLHKVYGLTVTTHTD